VEEIFLTPRDDPANAKLLDWIFDCSAQGCAWRTAHRTKAIAEKERDRHKNISCPYEMKGIEGRMPLGKQFIEKLWDELDEVTKYLMENIDFSSTDKVTEYTLKKGQARGLAIAIQLASNPFFNTPKEVAAWAVKRYRMYTGEREAEPTPGVRGYNPSHIIAAGAPKIETTKRTIRKASASKAPPNSSEIETLEGGIEAGFDDATLMRIVKSATPELLAELRQKVKVVRK